MILWLVALPGFLIMSSVYNIVIIMSLVPATACLLILGSLGAIIIAQWTREVQISKYEITVPVCIIGGTDNRAFGISGYFLQLLKYQDFWCISCILNELYCIAQAPSDVLNVEL
jgi:hypothetical protein